MQLHHALFSLIALTLITTTSCKTELKSDFHASTDTAMVGDVVQFTDRSTGFHHRWDFGDGEYSEINNPTHIYSNAGEYMVSLQVSDKKDRTIETSEQIITVLESKYNHLVDSTNKSLDSIRALIIGEWHAVYFGLQYSANDTYTDTISSREFRANGYLSNDPNLGITSLSSEWELIGPKRLKIKSEHTEQEYTIQELNLDNFVFYRVEPGNGRYDTITAANIR